ncbi:MAG: PEP-CTERM sorting domain-containing protein [Nitrospirae bacterium]|nr:PEP-CTERM sorting domain-containing protein [Nitrospirota bacterium]MBI4849993.1 PEP-CTERM sorting domain-containing protein [Nitrospirota bacterium]
MKKILILIGAIVLMLSFAGISGAKNYTFTPSKPDMYDLNHHYAYTWGIDWTLPSDEVITGAELTFEQISNWLDPIVDPNVLYVHLLDSAPSGVKKLQDNIHDNLFVDYFEGQGIELMPRIENLGTTPQDITFTLTASELTQLALYVGDGNFGFGFDPDCNFYNNRITFTTNTVPEPTTLILLGSGLVGAALYARRRKN